LTQKAITLNIAYEKTTTILTQLQQGQHIYHILQKISEPVKQTEWLQNDTWC